MKKKATMHESWNDEYKIEDYDTDPFQLEDENDKDMSKLIKKEKD